MVALGPLPLPLLALLPLVYRYSGWSLVRLGATLRWSRPNSPELNIFGPTKTGAGYLSPQHHRTPNPPPQVPLQQPHAKPQ